MIHYIPGCDVKKNHPQSIEKIEQYMLGKGAHIDACCRTRKQLLEDGDIMVTNCTMCQIVMEETHPGHESISLYEYVLKDENFPWVDHQGETITLQDCWRTRGHKEMLDAIRMCLKKMNFTIVEMKENRENITFDGVWKNNPIAPILLEVAPHTFHKIEENDIELLSDDKQKELMEEWVTQYSTKEVVVYCNGCERGLKLAGLQSIHLVELIAQGLN